MSASWALLLACLLFEGRAHTSPQRFPSSPYSDWDYLMFSQRWPQTTCSEWEEANSANSCNLPKDRNLWTIHGVWPTKTGHEGPVFCPSAIHFNPEELTPMLADLSTYWINVEANTKPNSFWAHEWKKHGTCASSLPLLDSVTNYFQTGLKLNRQYELADILAKGGVSPSSTGYDVAQFYNALKSGLGKEPIIHCVQDKKTNSSYISEIRICFNKTLEMIDCNPTNPVHRARFGLDTNCNQKKLVWYIPQVPPSSGPPKFSLPGWRQNSADERSRLLGVYRLLKLIQWITV
ncbi:ribonuclease Oy [Dendroctonus ponderosae]|uniref:Uncharacterized protein n=1 Tax=Dendroctonus ponderosae TaxID=77166 RepID=A0AAR5Q009_DENPD|nr:ribonuclease Oy [Dendroctonus ponderosae]